MTGVMLLVAVTTTALLLADSAAACPFYQLQPGRVNYTTWSDAYAAAVGNAIPVRVCDQAQIGATETPPAITAPVVVIGDTSPQRACWSVENLGLAEVFAVESPGVIFEDVQLYFNATLFAVRGAGHLTLTRSRLWFGQIGVDVATTGAPGTGLAGDHVKFMSVGYGVVTTAGEVECVDCWFINPRNASYVARTGAQLDVVVPLDNAFQDSAVPFGLQDAPGAPIFAAVVTTAYRDRNQILSCRNYPDSCVNFGSGGGDANNCKGFTMRDWVFISLFAIAFLTIFVGLIAVVVGKREYVENVIFRKP